MAESSIPTDLLRQIASGLYDGVYLLFGFIWAYIDVIYRLFVSPPLKNLDKEIILVTGAGNGMGREMCRYLAETTNATLICWDINQKDNDAVVSELKAKGIKATGYQIDITSREKIENLAKQVRKEVGNPTVVVNNAGIMPSTNAFLQLNPNEFERIYQVNVFSHYWILREFLPSMVEKNHGHILTMSSAAGLIPSKNSSVYTGSKHAVHGFVETLKLEMRATAPKIKFTTVYPTMVNTGLLKDCDVNRVQPIRHLEPREAAVEIIDGFRRNEEHVYLPAYFTRSSIFVMNMLVPKALTVFRDVFDYHLINRETKNKNS